MRRGFTLIEVLVVVAIIALLISILLPSLAQARDHARSAKCLANMRDMATGVNTFAATHRGRFQLVTGASAQPDPYGAGGPLADPRREIYSYEGVTPGKQGRALLAWPLVLLREAGDRGLKYNRDWGVSGSSASNIESKKSSLRPHELMICPSDKVQINTPVYPKAPDGNSWYGYLSYGVNEDIVGDRTDSTSVPPVWKDGRRGMTAGAGERLRGKVEQVIRPSEVLLFVDCGADVTNPSAAETLILSGGQNPTNTSVGAPHGPLIEHFEAAYGRLPTDRHRRGSLNVTFADGHGGFANRINRSSNSTSSPGVPSYSYLPKVRVSPYNSGTYPTN